MDELDTFTCSNSTGCGEDGVELLFRRLLGKALMKKYIEI